MNGGLGFDEFCFLVAALLSFFIALSVRCTFVVVAFSVAFVVVALSFQLALFQQTWFEGALSECSFFEEFAGLPAIAQITERRFWDASFWKEQ